MKKRSNANYIMKKEPDLSDLSPSRYQKVLMRIDEIADVFLNSTNFAQHTPSGFTLNSKALIKVSKVIFI